MCTSVKVSAKQEEKEEIRRVQHYYRILASYNIVFIQNRSTGDSSKYVVLIIHFGTTMWGSIIFFVTTDVKAERL